MKNRLLTKAQAINSVVVLFLAVGITACTKNTPVIAPDAGIPDAIKEKITAMGFHADHAQITEGGYLVEGDIFLSEEDLNTPADLQALVVANTEQYRTTFLVTGLPRNIRVCVDEELPTSIFKAVDAAIARYNAQNLLLTFSRVTSDPDINVVAAPSGADYIASAGFPTIFGNPHKKIKFNTDYSEWNANTLTSVIAHEMGHCIGFRHTDYMDRSYSCGGLPYNEGGGFVGAHHIPGTPTGPDANSWMLACIGDGVNRPFNANDKTALNYLY